MFGSDLTVLSEFILSSSDDELKEKLISAAQLSIGLEDQTIILLHTDSDEFDLWMAILNAVGLDIHIGTNGVDDKDNILFLVQAADWKKNRAKIAFIRERFTNSTLCILTGICRVNHEYGSSATPLFDDARSVLQAAGIGFFSVQRENYVAV
tara:strand:- start:418 stop:873 length:456 start_codon:yes stop_codon:yes gene_type:complete